MINQDPESRRINLNEYKFLQFAEFEHIEIISNEPDSIEQCEAKLMIGLPCSGKTTYALETVLFYSLIFN